jgi:hypothetical protein
MKPLQDYYHVDILVIVVYVFKKFLIDVLFVKELLDKNLSSTGLDSYSYLLCNI